VRDTVFQDTVEQVHCTMVATKGRQVAIRIRLVGFHGVVPFVVEINDGPPYFLAIKDYIEISK